MPRRTSDYQEWPAFTRGDLVERLKDELQNGHESGQPMIDEKRFENGRMQVTVVWDDWEPMSFEERTGVILEGYRLAEGNESRNRIALANGLTVPEAYSAGLLPYEIIPARRSSDRVTDEQLCNAMIKEGASVLRSPSQPILRFASKNDAEAAMNRLIQDLPGSEEIWVLRKEMGRVEEWTGR